MVLRMGLAVIGVGTIGVGIVTLLIGMSDVDDDVHYDPEYNVSTLPVPTPSPLPVAVLSCGDEPTGNMPLVQVVFDDLVDSGTCNKSAYAIDTEHGSDVYVCIHMAIEQAEYLIDMGYDAGVVVLYNKDGGTNHAQTWVIIDGERYIIESVYDCYWSEEVHSYEFSPDYKIRFKSVEKGREFAKESTEGLHR